MTLLLPGPKLPGPTDVRNRLPGGQLMVGIARWIAVCDVLDQEEESIGHYGYIGTSLMVCVRCTLVLRVD